MKNYLLLMIFLIATLSAGAQSRGEDVIYLKSGNVYRGNIIERIAGVSYKIEIAGGSIIVVTVAEVDKITKEKKLPPEGRYLSGKGPGPTFHYRTKGYFFQAQASLDGLKFGLHIINGYKFGQFGMLGLSVGADEIISDIRGTSAHNSGFFPFSIYYSGDLYKRHITPFYWIEAGYAYRSTRGNDYYDGGPEYVGGAGGATGGAGFGVKFYSRHRVHFSIAAHLDIQQATDHYLTRHYHNTGETYTYTNSSVILINPGLKFGVGF